MVHIKRKGRTHSLWLRVAGCLTTTALLCGPLPGFWPDGAWGQQAPMQLNPSVNLQKERRSKTNFAVQRLLVEPPAPNLTPIALPVTNPASALGSALISCDKEAEGFQPASLPGARGEIKLDQCYRGRDHLVCSFNALLSEAKYLIENYREIVNANYPAIGNVEDVCRRTSENLTTDIDKAINFSDRFKILKAQYEAHANCASRIEESLRDVTLPDMAQAPTILKSMIDSIEGDIKGLSSAQAQLVELAAKMDSSQKAILTIQKIHRAMCVRNQSVRADVEDRAIPTLLERTGPFTNR